MSNYKKLSHAIQVVVLVAAILAVLMSGIVIGTIRSQSSDITLGDEDIVRQEEVSGRFDETISLVDQPSGKVRYGECGMRYYYHEEQDGRQTLVILRIGRQCKLETSNYIEPMGGFFPWLPSETSIATVVSGGLSGPQLPTTHPFYCYTRITQVAVRVNPITPLGMPPDRGYKVLLTRPC